MLQDYLKSFTTTELSLLHKPIHFDYPKWPLNELV